jgi:WD40 repeat protein
MDLAVNAEARLVAALSDDQTAQIWDASSGRPVRTLRGVYNALTFSGDGTRLAAPFDPGYEGLGRVRVWDTDTWSTVQTVTGPPFSGDLVFNANADLLTVVGVDGKVRVFDTETWGVRSMTGNLGRIWGVTSDAGGQTIATASEGGLDVWDVDRGRVALVLNDVPFPPPADVDLAFSPDGTRLAAPTIDGGVTIYVLDIDELLRVARAEVTRGFTDQECRQFLHGPECPAS